MRNVTAQAAVIMSLWTGVATAQSNAPMSVIDWLDNPPQQLPVAPRKAQDMPHPDEPPVANSALAPSVTSGPIGVAAPRDIGLVPPSVTGLPRNLWEASDAKRLTQALNNLPELSLPAANAALYTLLLAEAAPPRGGVEATRDLTLARLDRLISMGALDPAQSLAEQAGETSTPAMFEKWMEISLLTGHEDRACDALARAPHLSTDYTKRIFCLGRAGEWDNANVTLNSAQALGVIDKNQARLLDHFLNPDLFEGTQNHRPPREMDPLTFRLFETVGEPLPTGPLPRAYAVADLRDIAGWKAQLEAAERLNRTGALPDNRLLGLYTSRRPAASGGVWDRAAALQRFETALRTRSPEAVAKTLPAVWSAMQEAELEVSFARLYARQLEPLELTGRAATLRAEIGLLSPDYERFNSLAAGQPDGGFLSAISQGLAPTAPVSDPLRQAVAKAFADGATPPDWVAQAQQGRLGETILRAITALEEGARGDAKSLRDALTALRALGMEDTARRAALQVSLLERAP